MKLKLRSPLTKDWHPKRSGRRTCPGEKARLRRWRWLGLASARSWNGSRWSPESSCGSRARSLWPSGARSRKEEWSRSAKPRLKCSFQGRTGCHMGLPERGVVFDELQRDDFALAEVEVDFDVAVRSGQGVDLDVGTGQPVIDHDRGHTAPTTEPVVDLSHEDETGVRSLPDPAPKA